MLVDTGSSVTIINPKLFEEIYSMRKLNVIAINIRLKSANGNNISAGECSLSLKQHLCRRVLSKLEITRQIIPLYLYYCPN